MKESKITCDNCNEDITFFIHILCLSVVSGKQSGMATCDVYWIPPIDNDKHFCGLGCLKQWLEKEKNDNAIK